MKRSEIETGTILRDVENIIENVKSRGDEALVKYSKEFEGVDLSKDKIRVNPGCLGQFERRNGQTCRVRRLPGPR